MKRSAVLSAIFLLALSFITSPLFAATINSILPNAGSACGGTEITIDGTGFLAGATVLVQGSPLMGDVIGGTNICVTTQSGVAGTFDVIVTNPDDTSATLAGGYTYEAVIWYVMPGNGPACGGTEITIGVCGFASGATVEIGSAISGGTVIGGTEIYVTTTGENTAGLKDVIVTNPDGTGATFISGYEYMMSTGAVSPGNGSACGGTIITITGCGFASAATVTIGTNASGITVTGTTLITATTPGATPGTYDVVVINPDGISATLAGSYTYGMSVAGIGPNKGTSCGGTEVTIYGCGFASGATVTIGQNISGGTVVGGTAISVTTPADNTAGLTNVIVTNPGNVSCTIVNGYNYLVSVSAVNPNNGSSAGGTAITITGCGFAGSSTVIIGTNASGIAVTGTTLITATTPANTAGIYDIIVINPDGSSGTLASSYSCTMSLGSITPANGSACGGTRITITGSGFAPGATVAIGTIITGGTVAGNTVIYVTTSLLNNTAGPVNVVVTNPGGYGTTLASAYTYNMLVASVNPANGGSCGGTAITIYGCGFAANATVTINNSITGVTVLGTTQINATTSASPAGTYNAVVANPDGSSGTLVSGFTYGMSVAAAAPANGTACGGTEITISGCGFVAGATVRIGNNIPGGTITGSTEIYVTTAGGNTAGLKNVIVINPDGSSATLIGGYTYKTAVTSISPNSGAFAGGTPVAILGCGFGAGCTVRIGNNVAPGFTVTGTTLITATTAATSAGVYDVIITYGGDSGTLASGYTYLATGMSASAVSPANGSACGGTVVTVFGAGFLSGATVTIGATNRRGTVIGSTAIYITTTANTSGTKNVIVTNPDATSATLVSGYTFNIALSSVSPNNGSACGGTVITVKGCGFASATTVTIGNTITTGTLLGTTAIYVTASSNNITGTTDVIVAGPGAVSATLAAGFTYSGPTVTGIFPNAGDIAGNTGIAVFGTNFQAGATVMIGSYLCTGVNVQNANTIIATTSAGLAGTYDVTITNPGGCTNGTFTTSYTYAGVQSVIVSGITPAIGSACSNTLVTITGTNFASGATVKIGPSQCTSVNVLNSSTITASAIATAAGTYDVIVKNADASSGVLLNGFTYVIPVVAGVVPNTGPGTGGTAITVTGNYFQSGAALKIGSYQCTGVTVLDSSTIAATTAAALVGTYSITVTNPDGCSGSLADTFVYKAPEYATIVNITADKDAEMTLETDTGQVILEIPAGTFTETCQATVRTVYPVPVCNQTGWKASGFAVEIILDKKLVAQKEMRLSMKYPSSMVSAKNLAATGLKSSYLKIGYYNSVRNAWIAVANSISSTAENKVCCSIKFTGIYQVVELSPATDLSNVTVIPNPFKPNKHSSVTFTGLTKSAVVSIYTVTGEKIAEVAADDSGIAQWDGTNSSGKSVASGVYLGFISDGTNKTTVKFAVQR